MRTGCRPQARAFQSGLPRRITFQLFRILRIFRILAPLALSTLSPAGGAAQTPSAPQWQIYASCATAYQANWQLRRSSRSQDMSNMIQEQAEDYKAKAARFYEDELKAQPGEARRIVETYVSSNLDRFTAMEKAGTLEAYIDRCPPD